MTRRTKTNESVHDERLSGFRTKVAQCTLTVLAFNDTSTFVGNFVSSLRKKGEKEIEEIVEEMKERGREERGNE